MSLQEFATLPQDERYSEALTVVAQVREWAIIPMGAAGAIVYSVICDDEVPRDQRDRLEAAWLNALRSFVD